MARSDRLPAEDLRSCFRLVGECRELGREPEVWRRHMIEGLARLLGTQVAIAGEAQWLRGPQFFRTEPPVESGWASPKARECFYDYLRQHGPAQDPIIRALARFEGQAVTRRRQELVSDRRWYGSEHYNEYLRRAEIDSCLHSLFPIDREQRFNIVCFFRAVGDRPFGARESALLHLFHHELGPLVGNRLTTESTDSRRVLAPRVRQTLACFLDGASEKEAAVQLGLSVATVHQYAKALYRHYGVRSRAGLLALWLRTERMRSRR